MPDKSREFRDRFAVCCALLAAPFALACSSGRDLPGMATDNTLSSGGQDGQSKAITCANGETRKCTKTLAQHGSVLSCYDGTETCRGSEWSQCEAGTVNLMSLPLGGLRGLLSLSQAPSSCADSNPCARRFLRFAQTQSRTPVTLLVKFTMGETHQLRWSRRSTQSRVGGLAIGANCPRTCKLRYQNRVAKPLLIVSRISIALTSLPKQLACTTSVPQASH